MTFNNVDPIILIGDYKGGVSLFKLSVALSEGPMKPEVEKKKGDDEKDDKPKAPPKTSLELEREKLEAFLSTRDKVEY